jgi:Fe-S oxidoreductase
VLATSCPYCIAMLQDSVRTLNAEERIQVKDLTELVYESLDG